MKKILFLILIVLLALSLLACSKVGNTTQKTDAGLDELVSGNKDSGEQTDSISDGFVFKNETSVKLGNPDEKLDPQSIYDKLTYTPEMFNGDYQLTGGKAAEEKFGADSQYFTWTKNGKEYEYTELPFRIRTGKDTMSHSVNFIEDYNWMQLYFMQKVDGKQYLDTVICSYVIEDNKLILNVLDTFEVDTENNKISYSFTDVIWEYTFSFCGRNLTLSTDNNSVTLTTGLDAYGTKNYFFIDHYPSPYSKTIDGIAQISFRLDPDTGETRLYFKLEDGAESRNSIAVLQENGLFTFTLALEESTKTYQFVYFYGTYDGLVLTDGTNVYYYTDTYTEKNQNNLKKYLTENQTGKLDELSDTQLEAIIEKKDNLIEDLANAFNDAGIKVTVDNSSGELAMDASVLFGGDSAVLTSEGKDFLNKFVDVYMAIVFSDKYDGFVSKTIVEGHTAPISGSTYESGLPLSEERANNVKNYCISSETDVDTSKLASDLEAVGYSNSRPVKDTDGNIDLVASRRVSFRFIINLDQQ